MAWTHELPAVARQDEPGPAIVGQNEARLPDEDETPAQDEDARQQALPRHAMVWKVAVQTDEQ